MERGKNSADIRFVKLWTLTAHMLKPAMYRQGNMTVRTVKRRLKDDFCILRITMQV